MQRQHAVALPTQLLEILANPMPRTSICQNRTSWLHPLLVCPRDCRSASLAGSSGVSLPTPFLSSEDMYKASIEDRKRIFGQRIVPQRSSKTLLQSMWLALKDKVLVRRMCSTYSNGLKLNTCIPQILLSIAAVVSLSLGLFQDFD